MRKNERCSLSKKIMEKEHMMTQLNPPWVYPRKGETVFAMQPLRTSLIKATYDFENQRWVAFNGKSIQVYGWIKR